MGNRNLTAMVLVKDALPETVKDVREKLTKLGFNIVRSTEIEGKSCLTITCQKEQFERVFKTKVEKVRAQGEPGNFTPEYLRLTEPVKVPRQLKRKVEEVFLPQPPTFF